MTGKAYNKRSSRRALRRMLKGTDIRNVPSSYSRANFGDGLMGSPFREKNYYEKEDCEDDFSFSAAEKQYAECILKGYLDDFYPRMNVYGDV